MLKRLSALVMILTLFGARVGSQDAFALTTPSFPSCANPQGNLHVSYSQGAHGIVGSSAEYRGSDTVYTLTGDTFMQCFCPDNGQTGIQTNWWKIPSLLQDEIQILKNDGWIYIPNGSLWGLEGVAYAAKNSDYSCRGGVGGSQSNASLVSTISTSGLAGTGGSAQIFALIVSGLLCLFTGLRLRRKSRRSKRLRLRLA